MKTQPRRLFFREDSHSPVHTGRLALIDVETSGFSFAKGAEIVEIAVLLMEQDGTVLDEYQTLVGARGGAGDPTIHQITNRMLRGAPSFRDIAGDLLDLIGDAVVVAHNASFEDRFLLPEFERAGVFDLQLPALCSLRAARAAMPYLGSHKLGDLVSCLGHQMRDAHTALGDVRALARILPEILEDFPALRFAPGTVPPVQVLGTAPHPRGSELSAAQVRTVTESAARIPRSRTPRETAASSRPFRWGTNSDYFDSSPAEAKQVDRTPRDRTPRLSPTDDRSERTPRDRTPRDRTPRADPAAR